MIPQDLEFRKSFVSIYHQFDVKDHVALEDIYTGIFEDFTDFEAVSFVCQKFMQGVSLDDPEFPQRLKLTVSAFEENLNSSQSCEFLSCYVSFLISTKTNCEDLNLVSSLRLILEKIFDNCTL